MAVNIIKKDYAEIRKVEEFNWKKAEQFAGYPAGEERLFHGKQGGELLEVKESWEYSCQ